MKSFTLLQFSKLIGEDSLVKLSSPDLEKDLTLPLSLLLSRRKIERLNLATYPDKWFLTFSKENPSIAIAVNDTGSLFVSWDTVLRPSHRSTKNLDTDQFVAIIKHRLGSTLSDAIVSHLTDLVFWQIDIEAALLGKFDYGTVSESHTLSGAELDAICNSALDKVLTLETLKKLL